MHREYYCPSLVQDIICGNVNRGKLYKGEKHPSKLDFEYWYNNKGKLIAARSYADDLKIWQTEFIFYKENVSTSIFFEPGNNDIELVTMCKYKDDLLIEYDYMLVGCIDEKKDRNNLNIEKYEYVGKMLRSCDTEIYLFYAGLAFKDHYDFEIRNHKLVCKDNI